MNTFTVVNDEVLVAAIERSRDRLAYIAPGISEPVASAIGRLFERAQPPAVTVIIDSDPEVCRLGYGTVAGLERLQGLVERHQFGVRHQNGLRVAVLASDDDLLVYAPAPQLIEAGSTSDAKPNAIVIGNDTSARLLAAAATEGDAHHALAFDAEIGRDALTPTALGAALKDLARTPPKAFDVARVERVFNSKLQYVELEITGYRLSARKVTLPNDLLIGDDPELENRLRNSFRLLEGGGLTVDIDRIDTKSGEVKFDDQGSPFTEPYSEQHLEADRKKLHEDFLTQVAGHGWLIRRWDREAFDQRVEILKQKIEAYRTRVSEALQKEIEKTIAVLARQLLAKLNGQLPQRLGKLLLSAKPTEEEMAAVLVTELSAAFGTVDQTFKPELKVRYKDLTYETIQDKGFKSALEAAFRRNGQASAYAGLFEEYDAAREAG